METFKKYTEEDFQEYFEADIKKLKETPEGDVKYIDKSHYGDFLVEEVDKDGERFRLWRNLYENFQQGDGLIEIEYYGKKNGYKWEAVYIGY